MIHVLYGTDEYTIQKTLRKIKEGLGDAESLTNNTVYLQGSKLTPDELRAHVQAMPFLAMHRLVIDEERGLSHYRIAVCRSGLCS